MTERLEQFDLCYLATIDGGNASLRWPQTDATAANRLQQSVYDREISTLLKLNLLWRPFVTVRHLELFDNLAFAKFIWRHRQECLDLAQAELLRLCAPSISPILQLTEEWIFGRGPQFPMHWHHLDGMRQAAYDRAASSGKLRTIEDIGPFLFLDQHRLDLKSLISFYQEMFPESGLIQLEPAHPIGPSDYARRVEQKWNRYLSDRRQQGLRMPLALRNIEQALEKCHQQQGRRRTYYTELRQLLESQGNQSAHQRETLENAIAETKCFVLNDAYYDEFECFTAGRTEGKPLHLNITASRDISRVWVPEENTLPAPVSAHNEDPLISSAFVAIERLALSDIVTCHTAAHDEALAFRKSVENLHRLGAMSGTGRKHEAAVREAVRDHLQILLACLRRVMRDANRPDDTTDCVAQVFFGNDPGIMTPMFSSGIGLAGMAYFASGLPAIVGLMLSPLLAIILRRKVVSHAWKSCEAALAEHIQDNLTG